MSIEAMKQEIVQAIRAAILRSKLNNIRTAPKDGQTVGDLAVRVENLELLCEGIERESYDQTALELCEECGWKALIPGDGCLVCARQKAVAWMYDFLADNEVIRDWVTQSYDDIKRENGFNVRPLYAAPPAIMQKPVAYADSRIHGWPDCFVMEPDPPHTVPLYTAPQEWVELTDDEARALVNRATFGDRTNWQALVYMVDAKLKEKNHG
jgi:hypothetical protein